ncbi:MAG: hypothetical protein PHE89_04500 [Alphaproteobacteria bacterium]|nr:hypothetical protein [Alphaproteobacteria bacterium]
MEKSFYARIEKISGVNVDNLTFRYIFEEVILSKIIRVGGQDSRGWRIPDSFMELMADFGDFIYQKDPYLGGILLELALQRISCGAVLHEPTSYKEALPKEYQKYSARYDQYGLMSEKCWLFLTKQIKTCLACDRTKEHAQKIVLGLLNGLQNKINHNGDYMFGGLDFKVSPQEGYDWAYQTVTEELPFPMVYEFFATPERWQSYSPWFRENWEKINQKDFFQRTKTNGFFRKRKTKKEIFSFC